MISTAAQRQRQPRRARAGHRGHRSLRRRARQAGRFLNVRADELVLCSGTTFAINLVAYSWALPRLKAGDTILVSRMEHHANIVPWQLVAQRTGATIKVAEILADGSARPGRAARGDDRRSEAAGVTHVSNVLGTVNPVREICREARKRGIVTVVDGSQAAPHLPLDVAAIGCDFYAITGHKMCGPTGTGALWARREHLQAMPPFLGGGEMIKEVSFDGTVFNDPPHKFEAGTPNIAGFIGLGAAVDYLDALGMGERRRTRGRTAGACHRSELQPHPRPAHLRHRAGTRRR
jgi:cysteine desulfurase/selenocysteine lyase